MLPLKDHLVRVSVVTPAFNAAATIADTLDSLCAQTYPHWEAIVVDDGSSDGTAAAVTGFGNREPRIRLIRHDNRGHSAARNTGIAAARYEWLLFLDADDWISPLHLQTLTAELTANPQLDAVHCLSARVAADGTQIVWDYVPPAGEMFSTLSHRVAFAIHACVVRKSLVVAAGQFDASFRNCADWDLWQRVARAGARFGAVGEVLAYYRMAENSVTLNAHNMVRDALRVLEQGHRPDPRVSNPHAMHAKGSPVDRVDSQVFYTVSWNAGVLLGRGDDARPLLDHVMGHTCPDLNPDGIAETIFESAILPRRQSLNAWDEMWSQIEENVRRYLVALEEHSLTPGLAKRAHASLRRRIVRHLLSEKPSGDLNDHDISKQQALLAELERLEGERTGIGWWLHVGPGNSAGLKTEARTDAVRVVIARISLATSYGVQLNRSRFQTRAGASLTLLFRARADRARHMFVGFSQGHEPWSGLGLYRRVDLTPEWQGFQHAFIAAADDDDARVHFDLGDHDIAVEVASVSLNALDPGSAPAQHPRA